MKGENVRTSVTFAALVALMVTSLNAARAASAPVMLRPEIGSAVAYHVALDGSFWNGAKTVFSRNVRLTNLGGGAVSLVSTGPAHDDDLTAKATLRKNGEVDVAGAADRVRSFNTVVQIFTTAPASIERGTSWIASVPMEFSATDATVDVPIVIKVVGGDADNLTLQGTGAQTVTTMYGGFPVPIDMDVRLAMRLTKTGLDRCDFAGSEVVHAGPQTQTLTWKWNMTPTSTSVGTKKT